MKEQENISFKENLRFPIWKEVVVGTNHNFVELIDRTDFNITSGAAKLIESSSFKSSLVNKEETIKLVTLSVSSLGFDDVATLKEIYDLAKDRGLSLCPFETGPQLYRQHRSEISEESVIIATRPISGLYKIFSIISDRTDGGKKCLSTCQGQNHMNFSKNSVFVFQLAGD